LILERLFDELNKKRENYRTKVKPKYLAYGRQAV